MKLIKYIPLIFFLFACKKTETNTAIDQKQDLEPVAYYTFSANANDQSKNVNNGIVFNTTLTVDSFGNENSAYYFNDSSYIEIKDNDALDMANNKLTICAWIKPSYVSGSYIIEKATQVYQGQLTQGGGPFSLDIYPGTSRALIYGDDGTYVKLTGTSRIKWDKWQHIALTWDGHIAYLYYNGKIEASEEFSKRIEISNGNVYIGAYKWSFPAGAFKGSIDNVRLYNRSLSTEEIQDLYSHYK